MDIREYAKLVKEVRELQKNFFKAAKEGHSYKQKILVECKQKEKSLDELTQQILDGNLPTQQLLL